jgi:hypothetical protein
MDLKGCSSLAGELHQVLVHLFVRDVLREFPETKAQGSQIAGVALQCTQ